MPGLEYLVPFVATAVLLSITPGPGMLYIAAQTMGRGQRAGRFSALGTHLASYVHIVAAAFGLSLFLQAVPVAFLVLKIVGAGYLFWLGLRFLLTDDDAADPGASPGSRSHVAAFKESLLVELTNPKSAVFFLAFLPQFVDQHSAWPFWLQIVVLGAFANLIFSFAELGCVVFADRVAAFVRGSRATGGWMRRAAGSVLVGLGANLLASQR